MQKISVQAYIYAGAYKCFYETATKKEFKDIDIDNNIKHFEKISKIIDFEKYKNMFVYIQKKFNSKEILAFTPRLIAEYYVKIYNEITK